MSRSTPPQRRLLLDGVRTEATSRPQHEARAAPPAPGAAAQDRTWPVAHEPEAVGAARRHARSVLAGWCVDGETADSVLLVVSELVTNAIEHAQPPVLLHLHRDAARRIWVGITDGGPASAQGAWAASCEAHEHGRGMRIVEALAAAHGFAAHPDGRATRWVRMPT